MDDLYALIKQECPTLRMDFSMFAMHWCRIAIIFSIDPLKMRPGDVIEKIIQSGKAFITDDEKLDVLEYLRDEGALCNECKDIRTLKDMVIFLDHGKC